MSESYQNKRASKLEDNKIIKKKLAIVHDANKYIGSMNSKAAGISLYSTANSQLGTPGKTTRIDISTIKRNCSIPYIHKKGDENETNPEKIVSEKQEKIQFKNNNSSMGCRSHHKIIQCFQEDYVLSPTKMSRIKGGFIKQSDKKCPTLENSTKEKIVILSTSNCKNIQLRSSNARQNSANMDGKKDQQSKPRIKFKIKQKNMSNLNIQKGSLKCNTQLPMKSSRVHEFGPYKYDNLAKNTKKEREKSEEENSRAGTPINEQQLIRKIKNNQKQINMKQMIETDKQVLKLFPKVDLTALIFKIKVEEHIRKENSIKKWSHFDYQNLSAYQL